MPQKPNDRDQRVASPVPQDQNDELEMADDEDVDDDNFDDETDAEEEDDLAE
ncbi:MAG TPA: hypothetical protein VJM31_16480 [Vicinamibacterales bacterium]|nr:hypothetical protein [Vicinamibacterales bacterium]